MTTSEKKVRIIAVPFKANFKKFAADLEKSFNELIEDGYSVGMSQHKQGMLLTAERQAPSPIQQFFENLRGPHGGEERESALGQMAQIVMTKASHAVDVNNPDRFREDLEKASPTLFRSLDAEALRVVLKEVQEERRLHDKDCDNDCRMGRLLDAVAQQIERHLQLHLQ